MALLTNFMLKLGVLLAWIDHVGFHVGLICWFSPVMLFIAAALVNAKPSAILSVALSSVLQSVTSFLLPTCGYTCHMATVL